MVLLQRKKLYFSKDLEGVQHFPGGVQHFPGGGGVQLFSGEEVLMLISFEIHITYDYPRGVQTPYPPLDPHILHTHTRTQAHAHTRTLEKNHRLRTNSSHS